MKPAQSAYAEPLIQEAPRPHLRVASVSQPVSGSHVTAPGRFHARISELMNLERDLLLGLVKDGDLLTARQEALVRWAITVARMVLMRTPEGTDVEVAGVLAPFRGWLIERLRTAIGTDGAIDGPELRSLCPSIDYRLHAARRLMLDHHINDFGADELAAEVQHKNLVLVLGGGGGCGFAHLATFELAERLGIKPKLIVGSSMGGLLGLFRSMDLTYDPELIAAALPETFDLRAVFSPFSGQTRFGFPGAFHMQLLRVGADAMYRLKGMRQIPRFNELPIRLETVVTGVRTGFVASSTLQRDIEEASRAGFSPFALRHRMRLFFNAARELSDNPRLLKQIVFGREEGTESFNVIEATGFSCSVPGLFNYDVFHNDPDTVGTLDAIFERHRIWRMTDGGVVNNVPSRVAWESVMAGNLGSRNALIFAGDAFAPSATSLPFFAIQQIARPPVLANRPFSDYHKTFKSPPSPINLSPSTSKLKRIVLRGLKELAPERGYLQRAMKPLPPYRSWSNDPG